MTNRAVKSEKKHSTVSAEIRRPTIGLGLIVRNEAADLPACLNSFLPEVNCCVLVDTGSTDDTVAIARSILEASGRRYHIEKYLGANDEDGLFCDFAAARNRYCALLADFDVEYCLSVDADDTLLSKDIAGALARQPADFYGIQYRMNADCVFNSYKIWRNKMGVKWVGRVHEYLNIDWKKKVLDITTVEVQHHWTTVEGQETGTQRNMRILRKEMYPPLRSLFYWANENAEAGNHEEAAKWYLEYIRRANSGEGAWEVELAHCYFRGARWLQHLGKTEAAVVLSKELLDKDPSWAESWCELAYISRIRGDWEKMEEYAKKALSCKYIPRLFSEKDKYTETPANMLAVAKIMRSNQKVTK